MEPECVAELRVMRKSLLEDYKISPSVTAACDLEIRDQCGGGLQREGKTLHCLMDLARPQKMRKDAADGDTTKTAIRNECKAEVREVVSRFAEAVYCLRWIQNGKPDPYGAEAPPFPWSSDQSRSRASLGRHSETVILLICGVVPGVAVDAAKASCAQPVETPRSDTVVCCS